MIPPIVRLMVACEDARLRKGSKTKYDIFGVVSMIFAPADAFPIRHSFAVYLFLTDGHGKGLGHLVILDDDTDDVIFKGDPVVLDFGNDPTALYGSTIRVPVCTFPNPGRIELSSCTMK